MRSIRPLRFLLTAAAAAALAAVDSEVPAPPTPSQTPAVTPAETAPGMVDIRPDQLPGPVIQELRNRVGHGEIVWRIYRLERGGETSYAVITDDELLVLRGDGTVSDQRGLAPDGGPSAAREPTADDGATAQRGALPPRGEPARPVEDPVEEEMLD